MTNWTDLHGDSFNGVPVLVTGGAGFIGSHLSEALASLGAGVRVLDDLSGADAANLEFDAQVGRIELVRASILAEDAVGQAIKGCRYVFHEAALPSVPRSLEMPRQYHEVNVTGTQILLDAAIKAGVQRVVFAGSSSAYGDSPVLPKVETMLPAPKSPYAANKLAGEFLMQSYASCFAIDTTVLRYFNIFGPRQNANSAYAGVIAAFAKALLSDRRPTIHGDGEQTRDFTYVDNAVQANLLAARSHQPLIGSVINVACGTSITVNELAARMARILGKEQLVPVHGPDRQGDVCHSRAELSLARKRLGYEPVVDFAEGLQATVEWFSRHADSLVV